MFAFDFDFDTIPWAAWLPVLVGLVVGGLVLLVAYLRARRRRRLLFASREEDLPWDEMLEMLKEQKRHGAEGGGEDLPPDRLLELLLSRMPEGPTRRHDEGPDEGGPEAPPAHVAWRGGERRRGVRRWGKPTEVVLTSSLLPAPIRGLVLNRSTGGLAIAVEQEAQQGAVFLVRSVEAPASVPAVAVEVRHCQPVSGRFILGCQFQAEIPWNVRVWFG
jgi:hypothetical protein